MYRAFNVNYIALKEGMSAQGKECVGVNHLSLF